MLLCHWSEWFFSVLNAVFLRAIFNKILVYWAGMFQHVTAAVKHCSFWCIFYFFICLSLYFSICCFSGHEEAAWLWEAGHHPFQLHVCKSSESCVLPVLYNGAELHNLVWCSVILWRRHLFCNLRQDTTLLCECFSFRECYADSEKQTQSGPFNIFTTATEIKKGKINTAKLCHEGTLSLKVTQASVHALSEGPSHHSQLLPIFSPCLVYLEQMPSPPVECHLHEWQMCMIDKKCTTDVKFIENIFFSPKRI